MLSQAGLPVATSDESDSPKSGQANLEFPTGSSAPLVLSVLRGATQIGWLVPSGVSQIVNLTLSLGSRMKTA